MTIAHTTTVGLLMLVTLAAALGAQAGDKGGAVPLKPISPHEMQERGVAGPLGPRLGTIIEIVGVIVANNSPAKADADLPYRLRVNALDGHPLKDSVVYPFVRAGDDLTLATPAVGDTFHYVGYETGGFAGSPDGEFRFVAPHATTGYAFETWFVVLAVK